MIKTPTIRRVQTTVEILPPSLDRTTQEIFAAKSHNRLERSMSIVASPRTSSISLLPSLTPSQVQTIRKSWKHINTKGLYTVIRRCFQQLECMCPSVSNAFNSANNQLSANISTVRTLVEHTKFMLILIDRIVENDQDSIIELRRIGASHVVLKESFGFGENELEKFGEMLAEAFLKLDGIRQSKETSRAWRLVIASMIDQLRAGFDSEWRVQKRRASFNSQASGGSPEPENRLEIFTPQLKGTVEYERVSLLKNCVCGSIRRVGN
uniref:GLOBIN domain-containing protein n=1 Tax=Ascaris lumbricoides TaxID=6252 RepID=A0A0M3HYR2_ASCLU